MAKDKGKTSEQTGNEAEGESPKKKKPIKLVVAGVVLIGGAFYVGQTMGGDAGVVEQTTIAIEVEETTVSVDPLAATAVTLEPVVVNLSDGTYLKVGMTVTVSMHSDAAGGHGEVKVDVDEIRPRLDVLRAEATSYLFGTGRAQALDNQFLLEFKAHMLERAELTFDHSVTDIAVTEWVVS